MDDGICDWALNFLCKISMNTTRSAENSLNNTFCPNGWSLFNGKCYFIFNYPLSQASAQGYCPSFQESSYLANIESSEELLWVQSFVQANSSGDVWVT